MGFEACRGHWLREGRPKGRSVAARAPSSGIQSIAPRPAAACNCRQHCPCCGCFTGLRVSLSAGTRPAAASWSTSGRSPPSPILRQCSGGKSARVSFNVCWAACTVSASAKNCTHGSRRTCEAVDLKAKLAALQQRRLAAAPKQPLLLLAHNVLPARAEGGRSGSWRRSKEA